MKGLRDGKMRIMVEKDIEERGIEVKGIRNVVN